MRVMQLTFITILSLNSIEEELLQIGPITI
jgi:hypothetical protein